jgi:predicted RNA-binding Zn-ribbon protein involved in translation (DUF1610 family)
MSKFKCPKCEKEFEINYFKWIFTALFHWFSKRKTKCPHCGEKSWVSRIK